MYRRQFLFVAGSSTLLGVGGFVPAVYAQISGLSDAINKAGRQRMLCERMGKAWLALAHGVEKVNAQSVLDKSLSQFDRQLVELKAYASSQDIQDTYANLETAWSSYKTALVGAVPAKANAEALLQLESKVLTLAHQGTLQYETLMGKPLGKLVNIAGRQRMLSQRMAMLYFAAKMPGAASSHAVEIGKARTEFVGAMGTLRNASETTDRIKDELLLADTQWVFFDAALKKLGAINHSDNASLSLQPMSDVFVASENLLTVMDRVTSLYTAIKS